MAQEPHSTHAAAAPAAEAPKPDPDRAKATQGAQVILDPKSDAALGAKGGAFANIEDNTNFRNAGLIAANLDPNGPSAQLTDLPPDTPAPIVPVVASTTGADTVTGGAGNDTMIGGTA